ncbi:Toxoplasma gondii family A protein [Toxoplasma gondii ME49]|uniref:Toxoplasma gondii family A protein n=1 Tax=Toxoplasma gondii (strain ATCC 50611 / Me49) TaxID=508771 RepID=S8EPU7_TOXGM|nr:Toxoplasma gondii family A protein [Toxoplasma gondii ME49]EPT25326.1 Toxoplasma gondii family A protein [Toxoplasma gondii ME49]|eukprot:XP_002370540.2 Toxoplasma gondii family A protein [Toxoplasma gondii ME49]
MDACFSSTKSADSLQCLVCPQSVFIIWHSIDSSPWKGRYFAPRCLALLMNSVLPSVASETNHLTPEADFTATIPKSGLERNVEKVFSLGPSDRLQVIDETASAVYLPQKSGSNEDNSSGQYGTAYLFLNGTCDFDKTIQLKDAFPGYPKPLWVREESSSSGNDEEASSKRSVRYIFTNPPEEHLGKVTSFCVRFKTVQASGSNTETSTTAPTTSATSSGAQTGGATIPGNGDVTAKPDNPELHPDGSGTETSTTAPTTSATSSGAQTGGATIPGDGNATVEPVEPSVPSPPSEGEPGAEGQVTPSPEEIGDDEQVDEVAESPEESLQTGGHPGGAEAPREPAAPGMIPAAYPIPSLTSGSTAVSGVNDKEEELNRGVNQPGSARLRRLNVTPEAEEAFLTIVIHSAAWSVAGGISTLSVFLSAAAVTLLPTF